MREILVIMVVPVQEVLVETVVLVVLVETVVLVVLVDFLS